MDGWPRCCASLVAGAALYAMGVASGIAGAHTLRHAHFGLLIDVLSYNAMISIFLACAGLILQMAGALLWPAVALHAVLAIWCLSRLCSDVTAKGCSFLAVNVHFERIAPGLTGRIFSGSWNSALVTPQLSRAMLGEQAIPSRRRTQQAGFPQGPQMKRRGSAPTDPRRSEAWNATSRGT